MVFIPKRRRKTLYGALRKYLGEVFHRLAQQKESRIEEGHLMPDHVHMLLSMPVGPGSVVKAAVANPSAASRSGLKAKKCVMGRW